MHHSKPRYQQETAKGKYIQMIDWVFYFTAVGGIFSLLCLILLFLIAKSQRERQNNTTLLMLALLIVGTIYLKVKK